MKKLLTLFIILSMMIFLFTYNLNAKKDKNKYIEDYHIIKFKNLNSKDLNEIFTEITATIIDIEIQTPYFTKNYQFHTGITSNIEKMLLENITKDLKQLGKQELATTYQINGVKINKMKIICTNEEIENIKTKTEIE